MSNGLLPHIATMVFNTPLLITQGKLDAILAFLSDRMDLEDIELKAPERAIASSPDPRIEKGIGIIPVFGTLVHRGMTMASSGLTSYTDLRQTFRGMRSNPDAKSILFDVASNGGEVAGLFDFVDEIFQARKEKSIYAIANEAAYSAAYAIASAASQIFLTRTAGIGNIGVIALHVDTSKMDEKQGLKYTPIYRGAKKADLNSHFPITDQARADVQAKVDRVYDIFVSTVARNRGLAADVIKGTEAGIYIGEEALQAGLADGVMNFGEIIEFIQQSHIGGIKTMGFFFKSKDGAEIDIEALSAKNTALEAEKTRLTEELQTEKVRADGLQIEKDKATAQIVTVKAETEKVVMEAERARVSGIMDLFVAAKSDDLPGLAKMLKEGTSVEVVRAQLLAIEQARSAGQSVESRTDAALSGQVSPLIENAKQRAAMRSGYRTN